MLFLIECWCCDHYENIFCILITLATPKSQEKRCSINCSYTLFTRKVELDGFKLKVLVITAEWKSRSRIRKIEDNARTSPEIWKTVNYSTKG